MRDVKDVLQEITKLRLERGWSEYELAKNTGLSQSTISTWYGKGQVPTIQTLEKVCRGFGITLSQFFCGRGRCDFPDASAEGDVGSLVGPESKTAGGCYRAAQKYDCGRFCNLIPG